MALYGVSVRAACPADTGTKLNLSLLGLKSIWNPASLQSLGGEALDRENLTGPPPGSF